MSGERGHDLSSELSEGPFSRVSRIVRRRSVSPQIPLTAYRSPLTVF